MYWTFSTVRTYGRRRPESISASANRGRKRGYSHIRECCPEPSTEFSSVYGIGCSWSLGTTNVWFGIHSLNVLSRSSDPFPKDKILKIFEIVMGPNVVPILSSTFEFGKSIFGYCFVIGSLLVPLLIFKFWKGSHIDFWLNLWPLYLV